MTTTTTTKTDFTIVPALPGFMVVSRRPNFENQLVVHTIPIIAWRIYADRVEPVTPSGAPPYSFYGIRYPDGITVIDGDMYLDENKDIIEALSRLKMKLNKLKVA